MLKVGKLYSCSEYFLLLYPDKDTARTSFRPAAERDLRYADADAAYWTRELGKPVSYCNPLAPLLVLTVEEKYVEVLAGDQKGWINYQDWLEIKEITDEAA